MRATIAFYLHIHISLLSLHKKLPCFSILLVRKQGSPIHSLLLLVAVRHVHVVVVQFNSGKHRVHGNFSGPRPILRFHSLPV